MAEADVVAANGRRPLDHLRIKHLRLIEYIRETGSLSGAAQRMALSQPAITGMVHDLEEAFGVRLFERTPRGAILSAAGQLALERVRHALAAVESAHKAISEAPGEPLLRLGVLPLTAVSLVPQALGRLEREGMLPRIVCRQDSAPRLITALHRGELDGVIGVLERASLESGLLADLKFEPVARDGLMVACAPDHPLAGAGVLPLARFLEETWVLPPATSHTYRVWERVFVGAGLSPPVAHIENGAFQGSLAIVSATSLCTVAPASAVRRAEAEGLVSGLSVAGIEDSHPLFFVTHRRGPDLQALWRLRTALEQVGREGAGL